MGAPVTYCTICRIQSSDQNPPLFFHTPTHHQLFFFRNKRRRKENYHLLSKNWNFLGSNCVRRKVIHASDPVSEELNSDDASPGLVTRDLDSIESFCCKPRHSFNDGFVFRHCEKNNRKGHMVSTIKVVLKSNST